jgi:hypothetical protein
MWDRAWIRDAVVATTVRVGVESVDRVEDVPSAPNALRGAAAGVFKAPRLQQPPDE